MSNRHEKKHKTLEMFLRIFLRMIFLRIFKLLHFSRFLKSSVLQAKIVEIIFFFWLNMVD